jgi:glycoside/pentoside/hexuronide:cation symporter, GPH family
MTATVTPLNAPTAPRARPVVHANLSWREGVSYGLLGAPLAFVALPLYVILPNYYAKEFGVALATLGALLLLARLFDAFIDPLLGRFSDRLFERSVRSDGHSARSVLSASAAAAVLLFVGFAALFFPPVRGDALLVWAAAALLVTYVAYSFITVSHQSWGARLGGDEALRARVVSWREALSLIGVLAASVLPVVAGMPALTAVFGVLLIAGWLAWTRAPQRFVSPASQQATSVWLPWRNPGFRTLMFIFVFNGIASAIPATLVLFFVQDVLQAPKAYEGAFLGAYFLAGALSIPLWLKLIARIGLALSWLVSMVLAVGVFIWAATLGSGDIVPYLLVCVLSGIALGADLACPGALLAGVIAKQGDQGQHEGAYFGWWNFATKLNLALAAGLALPALEWGGYTPGLRTPEALSALVMAYCLLPCALKLIAICAVSMRANALKSS